MPGRRPPATLADVARAAGVHQSTVSRALDPARRHLVGAATRVRILGLADTLGYQVNTVARTLRTGASGLVGVIAPDVANPFIAQFLRGAEEALHGSGLMLLISESHDDSATMERLLGQLVTRRLDALVVTAARRGDEAALHQAARSLPVVLAVRSLETGNLPTVVHDDRRGAALAADHLIALGHRRLAQVRGSDDISSFRQRAAGFAERLARSDARDVSLPGTATEPSVAQGRALAQPLLDLPPGERPTAVFAHNDLMAVGVLDALVSRRLRCPEDISVVGYNDAPLAGHVAPPLTTIRVPTMEMGVCAGRLVTALMAGADQPEVGDALVPELVLRRSTAPPPRSQVQLGPHTTV